MSSPLEVWEPEIRLAIFRAAPQKAERLARLLTERGVTIDFVYETGLHFRAYDDEPKIEVGWPALEALWCATYAYVALYQTRCASQRTEGHRFRIGSVELSYGRELFGWSLGRLKSSGAPDWPASLPPPTRALHRWLDGLVVELFLVAAAWILQHECGHQLLQRPRPVDVSPENLEWEADRHATAWLLEGVANDEIATKLGMGICVAVGLLEAHRDNRLSHIHPSPFDRLNAAMRYYPLPIDGLAYAFALSVLHMNWFLREYRTWIQVEERCFQQLFEDFGRCLSGQTINTWVSVRPEEAVRADTLLSAPLDPAATRILAYNIWECRYRPWGSPNEDWFAAETLQHELRLEAVIVWLLKMAQDNPGSSSV